MRTDNPVTIFRRDYQPYPYTISRVSLVFDLDPHQTFVQGRYEVARSAQTGSPDLVLDGESLTLESLKVDGKPWPQSQYRLEANRLTLMGLPARCEIEITGTCNPEQNTALMGLYVSNDTFFTQCEAEGFRRIAWFPDRPDVMSIYDVTLRADATRYPVLLANGNLVAEATLPDGRHQAHWHDPFPKPCYLFALVAGKLEWREQRVTTGSGRSVLLQVYTDPGNLHKTEWAMACLERALRWDESRFGLELDLDRFMIVAVRDFNMGAMENKGLNVFNAAYVLADPDTATDANYRAIEAVIGHEYFHNWTGNRITCRDWFQLSLKEGLTVFRDQEFTADMLAEALASTQTSGDTEALAKAQASARAVKRIDDVVTLRTVQFPEDAGPMAHPIRPESYQEIGNFYTATIYEKGAEVIRMQHTLLGEAGFQAGMAEYFRRHDGQAVTCDDFVSAMEHAYGQSQPGRTLTQFREWYRQAGTPWIEVDLDYDAEQRRCTLTLTQRCPPVGVEPADMAKPPLHIPVAVGLLSAQGEPLPLTLQGHAGPARDTFLLELTQSRQQWCFTDIPSRPVPSLLRDFSAPVRIRYPYPDEELAVLFARDPNAFARWEAGQELAARTILALAQALAEGREAGPLTGSSPLLKAWQSVLQDPDLDPAWRTRALSLPSERVLLERFSPCDPQALSAAREQVRQAIGQAFHDTWQALVATLDTPGAYSPDPTAAGRRDLRHLALNYWLSSGDGPALTEANRRYQNATNMTDRLGALSAMVNQVAAAPATQAALADFYERWQHDPLVIDKWFALQASAPSTDLEAVQSLMSHPAFTLRNPNRARAVLFQFCLNNSRGFHRADAQGYAFWARQVLALDALNPEIAARFARALEQFRHYAEPWQGGMRAALEQVHQHAGLSRNVHEIVAKALEVSQ